MSSPNLELVQSIYADWARGDFSRMDWADPKIDWVRFGVPGANAWTGVSAMMQAADDVLRGYDQLRAEAEEYRDLGDERVLVLTRWIGRDASSGSDVEQLRANLFRVRDGKVVRLIFYHDRSRAFADLGLPPET